MAKGDTLYSIAWRYDLDVRRLARANRVAEPYTIFPGQRLNLDLSHIAPAVAAAPAPASPKPAQDSRPFVKRSNNRATSTKPAAETRTGNSKLNWQWPVDGTILSGYSGEMALNKGIDISAEKGEPVRAAEAGSIVYAGNGLRGYGNLLIIKHNQNYLSAYAHNSKLLVAEGETVKAGQQIAKVGSSGTNRDKLHFEIRRDGKPVDPLRYLPSRNR
ncbi:peptidoglycan DD-metalloendopeptidase family protein [Gilvimarinus sp. F26214L]|uniref:peptidoglycan DD-metalloendopeptidase family protein n=1 Tax=Gilvimarinus sp. DZF01 TaxID=3461371 RepID=UPI00404559DC